MRSLHTLRHGLGVLCQQRVEQGLGGRDASGDLAPAVSRRGAGVFTCDLAIGYEHLSAGFVVGQVSQVYEQGEHIVGAIERRHVVVVGSHVDFDPSAAHKLDHLAVQAVQVHVDIASQSLEGLCLRPVAGETPVFHRAHDGAGIVNLACAFQAVAVVPRFAFVEVTSPLPAEALHLAGGEPHVRRHPRGLQHAVLVEHVERRVAAVLFHRQNARHVGERDVGLVLEPGAQKVEVAALPGMIRHSFAHYAVPFVDDDDELVACLSEDV